MIDVAIQHYRHTFGINGTMILFERNIFVTQIVCKTIIMKTSQEIAVDNNLQGMTWLVATEGDKSSLRIA